MSYTEIECPECRGKLCRFCYFTGTVKIYPSPDMWDILEIARARFRINERR
jgi:hypothetical protein